MATRLFPPGAEDVVYVVDLSSYVLREVNIGSNEPVMYAAAPMARMKTMGAADESLPVELGKGSVTVSVNGSVQMTK